MLKRAAGMFAPLDRPPVLPIRQRRDDLIDKSQGTDAPAPADAAVERHSVSGDAG